MALKPNVEYFKTSINNPESNWDDAYVILEYHKDIDEYTAATIRTKELLTTIKTLELVNQDATGFYHQLLELWNGEFGNRSEFNCFLATCDASRDEMVSDFELFKKVVRAYIVHREMDLITPRQWVQALIDSGASRCKGSCGEIKLANIAENIGFSLVNNWDDFMATSKAVARFSSKVFNLKNIKERLNIELPNEKQNKLLDIILKNNDKYMFIEAKHLKEQGGEQNKQLEELLSLLKHNMPKNVMLGSFLDGVYSNKLISDITEAQLTDINEITKLPDIPKINAQKKELVSIILRNKNVYWFNTAGYSEFVQDFYNL